MPTAQLTAECYPYPRTDHALQAQLLKPHNTEPQKHNLQPRIRRNP